MAARPSPPKRVVKPRKLTSERLPVLAVAENSFARERTGEILPLEKLPKLLRVEPSSLIIVQGAGRLLRFLDSEINNPLWQFRVSPLIRELYLPHRTRRKIERRDTIVGFLGWRDPANKRNLWHYPIDPTVLTHKTIHEIYRDEGTTLEKLLRWGVEMREHLAKLKIKPKPTGGGIAGQLLKDPRFYPEPRRKVPRATNAKARTSLPGNFYELYCELNRPYQAAYIDQSNAHHTCAQAISFPCANSLRGMGRFRTLKEAQWKTGRQLDELLAKTHGLFYLGIRAPVTPRKQPGQSHKQFPLPCISKPGFQFAFVYSNELDYLRELGTEFVYAVAAWGSREVESGLNRFADWSLEQLRYSDTERKRWLKPILLSTYGTLAAVPREREFGFKQANGGELTSYPCGSGMLIAKSKKTTQQIEMTTANVIHRGMIEAETRIRSLRLATELASQGHRVLAVYADSVFVEVNGQLPLLAPPWRIEQELDGLVFHSSTSFSSRQLTKLPGVPREGRERVQRAMERRALQAASAKEISKASG